MEEGKKKRLIDLAQGGDVAALGELFELARGVITNKVRSFLRNRQEVDDIVQDTFIKVCQGIKSYRGEAELQNWMVSIALNLCKEHFRKEQAHPHETIDEDFPEELVRAHHENPEGGRTKRGGIIEPYSPYLSRLNQEERDLTYEEFSHIMHTVLEEEMTPEEANALRLFHFQSKRMPADKVAEVVGFSTRTKIYEIRRKYVEVCLKAREKLLRSKGSTQPVERSP